MIEKEHDWITLDYLEFFCQRNQLVIGCKTGEEEVWVSALGPHPSELTADEVHAILRHSSVFELRNVPRSEENPLEDSNILTRPELAKRLRRLLN